MSKFSRLLIVLAVAYLVWHLGRWFEFKRVVSSGVVAWYVQEAELIDPFPNATSDLYIAGDWGFGLCLPEHYAKPK